MRPARQSRAPAAPKEEALTCGLRKRCKMKRHRVVTPLVTCILDQNETCHRQVVFGPDAFCGLLLKP